MSQAGHGIAVLCLGYLGNPLGLVLLARYCARANATLFVHIDAKVPIKPYRDALLDMPHVHFAQRRIGVYWGGFSIVRATISMIEQAQALERYDRFCLITEDSIPLVAPAQFRRLMQLDCEYMATGHITLPGIIARYEDFYLLDCAATNPRTSPAEARRVTDDMLAGVARLTKLRRQGKAAVTRLHHGSTYWALTSRAIAEILERFHTDHHLRASFEFSFIPEEQYFHTILGNAAGPYEYRRFLYADFARPPAVPYVYFTIEEFTSLRQLPYIFARKAALHGSGLEQYYAQIIEQD